MADLIALAGRVEKLSGPDRHVDLLIALHVGAPNGKAGWAPFGDDAAPHYTASLDAAMQLVPDGYVWTMHTFPDKSSCFLMKGDYKMIRPENQFQATPALALCAAALKARAHLEGE